ncbi:SMP-30/gluconolactonase/LRE family protein [Stappia sp. GBMRC 2046]|uniref:SMP-30/gluconolactonase/LRE family protein n=1 Tax=Stappia sediminis TaxID=2692190 RepID=A0A7X3S9H1_9HYPH|nr:SMP-30/gluconolactonase/LRE family protein [Stappia sediminis]MXN66883.1 SMP-30/gluconolactonase/LRE family protein [Stappia sediminis]
MTHDIHCLIDARHELGEGATWDERTNRLLWCDIKGCAIHAYDWASGEQQVWSFPDTIGSFGLTEDGRFIVARRNSVVLFDPQSGEEIHIADIEKDNEHTRTNDGKVGPDGAFWVGTMHDHKPREPLGALYRVTVDGSVTKIVDGLYVSNGLAWSPDGTRLYHADSSSGYVDIWDFDPATGSAANRRRFVDLKNEDGRPDGATTDTEGNYWSAGVSAGVVNCFSPDGELIEKVPFPVPRPTIPCFCGPDLDTLVVTSLRPGDDPALLEEHPMSGSLFAFKPGKRGLPPYRFRIS